MANNMPWYSSLSSIKTVIVEEGITKIGTYTFNDAVNLTSITLPNSLDSIGDRAFSGCDSLKVITSLNPSPPSSGGRPFYGLTPGSITVPVLDSLAVTSYLLNDIWKDFKICTYVTGVTLDKNFLSLATGSTFQLTATVHPSSAFNKNVIWSSSDTTLVTVTQDGNIHTRSSHTPFVDTLVYISVQAEDNNMMNGNIKDSCAVYITQSANSAIGSLYIYYKSTSTSPMRSSMDEIDGYDLIVQQIPPNKMIEVEDKVRHVKLEFKPEDPNATIEQPEVMYLTTGDNHVPVTVPVTVTAPAGNKGYHDVNIVRQDFHAKDLIYTYTYINDKAKTVRQSDTVSWERGTQHKDIILPYSSKYLTVNVRPTFDYIESTVIDSVDVHTEPVWHDIILTNNYDREKGYTIKVQKRLNPHFQLLDLNVAGHQIEPRYQLNIYNYKLNVSKTTDKININAVPVSPATVSGPTGEQHINEGNNLFTFNVTGETGNTATYTLDVYREYLDRDIFVLDIAVNPDAYLNPPFNSNITDYTPQ